MDKKSQFMVSICLGLILLAFVPVTGVSTELRIVKYAVDGSTILNETKIDYRWMEQNLPVKGDGTTHYFLQGPVFVDKPEDRWNPAEDSNVREKDMGAIKGTDIRDLCNLVGGMSPGDELKIKATDGFSRSFPYENVYEPSSRQGPTVIAWYRSDKGYVPAYNDGMRLLFLADTSTNPWGIHAMGVWDWHESADEKYWYYYYDGKERYPTTTGLSAQSVGELLIYSQEEPSGTIHVTSLPEGAKILLDDEDTGKVAPADLPGIAIGSHMILVRKEGYQDPEAQLVDVTQGRVTNAVFSLEKAGAGTTSGSEYTLDNEPAGGSGESEPLGSALDLYSHDQVSGNISLLIIKGLKGPFKGGEERIFTLPGPSTGILSRRFYVFSSDFHDSTNTRGENPSFILETGQTTVKPDRIYSDQGRDTIAGTVTTCSFIPPEPAQDPEITLKMLDPPGSSCVLKGAALLIISGNSSAPRLSYWIFEGADTISAPSGLDAGAPATTIEFYPDPPVSGYSGGILQFASTGNEYDPFPGYNIELNGESLSGKFIQESGPVFMAEMPVAPSSTGSHVKTNIRAVINGTGVLYGETRLVVFSLYGAKTGIPVTPVSTTTGIPELTHQGGPVIKTPVQVAPGVSAAGNLAVRPGPESPPGPADRMFNLLDGIFTYIFALFGEKAPLNINTALQGVETEQGPVTEHIPYPDTAPPASYEVSQEGENITGPMDPDDDTGSLVSPSKTEIKPETGPQGPPGSPPGTHSGGIYVTSYPAGVELRVDNKKINTLLPAVIYGLKEGMHTIEVRLTSEGGKITSSQSSRVLVYADMITTAHFDLAGAGDLRKLKVISGNGKPVSFTVNGYYPLRRSPSEIELRGADSFITVIRDGTYVSYMLPPTISETPDMTLPAIVPPLYKLRIESTPPGGKIFIDGASSGYTTPAMVSNLSSGPHRLTVSLPGYVPGETVFTIPIKEDLVVRDPVIFVLDTYPNGPLTVESIPPGGAISIDGYPTGEKTPFTFDHIPLGIHEISVRRNDESRTLEVNIRPERSQRQVILFKESGTFI